MSADLVAVVNDLRKTNVTKTVHSQVYDAISPTRPELSHAGKTILITGGGTNVGLGIASSFVHASASTVIIVGRRAEVLEQAKIQLEAAAKAAGTGTKILARACDIVNTSDADGLWAFLSQQNIAVDVFVSNAAKMVDPEPMMRQGFSEVWSQVEANLKAPMYFAEKFYKQGGDRKKVGDWQFQTAPMKLRTHANKE
jgi:short-subunit dehydrogenase involved in D-alanine esterification of teichoic acids